MAKSDSPDDGRFILLAWPRNLEPKLQSSFKLQTEERESPELQSTKYEVEKAISLVLHSTGTSPAGLTIRRKTRARCRPGGKWNRPEDVWNQSTESHA
jgi:hypothetical protein